MNKFLGAAVSVALLAGCASKSQDVSAAHVSTTGYKGFTCEELVSERETLKAKIVEVAQAQDSKAGNDAAAVAVGAIVFLPVLLFLAAGDDKSGELSRLKGEFDAVTAVAKDKDCISAEQLQAEEEQRIAAEKAIEERRKAQQSGLRATEG